jgi:hypothetical protein
VLNPDRKRPGHRAKVAGGVDHHGAIASNTSTLVTPAWVTIDATGFVEP